MAASESMFQQVYGLCFRKVFAYFSACFGNAAAEDLSQTVFLKLWTFLETEAFREPDNWQAWIFRVAVNVKNDFLRRKQRQGEPVEYNDALENEPVKSDGEIEFSMAVRRAFDTLPEEDREILTLKSLGFSGGEIAGLLQMNPSTVRSRLSAAKRRFEESLIRNGVECHG